MAFTFRPRKETQEVILHDLHTATPLTSLAAWLKVTGRQRGLLTPGYHFVIALDGKHMMLRPLDAVGNHTLGYNKKSIGIALEGGRRVIPGDDGEEILITADTFTEAQRETLRWLVKDYIGEVYGPLPIRAHSECGRHTFQLGYPCPALNIEALREHLAS